MVDTSIAAPEVQEGILFKADAIYHWLSKWRSAVTWTRVQLLASWAEFGGHPGGRVLAYRDIEKIEVHTRWWAPWATLALTQFTGSTMAVSGLKRQDALAARKMCLQHRHQALNDELKPFLKPLFATSAAVSGALAGAAFVPNRQVGRLLAGIQKVWPAFNLVDRLGTNINPGVVRQVRELRAFAAAPRNAVDGANQRFIKWAADHHGPRVEQACGRSLTPAQMRAVLTDEDNTLVLAGAGTGKTAVIVAKISYLLLVRKVPPAEILVLTFNRDAAQEIRDRLDAAGLPTGVEVRTFHGLGRSILVRFGKELVDEIDTDIDAMAKEEDLLKAHIEETLERLYRSPNFRALFDGYFQSLFSDHRSIFDFESEGQYWEYLKSHRIVSLAGHYVRSFEECEISNFLYMNGIEHSYETPYPENVSSPGYKPYAPDFCLPGPNNSKIWIEHFGTNRQGQTAPWINAEEYNRGMTWKRNILRERGQRWIETFSYEKQEGVLLSELRKKLHKEGIVFRPLPASEMFARLRTLKAFALFSKLIASFLKLYKADGLTIANLRARIARGEISPARAEAFLAIFEPVLDAYQATLTARKTIDFSDMIAEPTRLLDLHGTERRYQHILVDEFQDLAPSRGALVRMLRIKAGNPFLFCVGDDWQAIYRFTGSDPSVIRNFETDFGFTKRLVLDRTFRCNNVIGGVGRRFVMREADGLQDKKIDSEHQAPGGAVFTIRDAPNEVVALDHILEKLSRTVEDGQKKSVFLLGRANVLKTEAVQAICARRANLICSFSTVHSAKGLEADYVILLGLAASGSAAFPSKIVDDSLLNLVLPPEEGSEHAEERRLFYVALTRAKHAVFLIADREQPSDFVLELERKEMRDVVRLSPVDRHVLRCPSCRTGLIITDPKKPLETRCTNAGYCRAKPVRCACGNGVVGLVEGTNELRCSDPACTERARLCPKCSRAPMALRGKGKKSFWGCTRYPACDEIEWINSKFPGPRRKPLPRR